MAFVLIVTYNELENLRTIVPLVLAHDVQLIIVDDQSPDGSPAWLREYAQREPRLHPLIRSGKLGYGTAVLAGIEYALAQGAERLITLDADLSHDPAEIPAMLAALDHADVVLGSRYVGGCRVLNWQLRRLMVSVFANAYVRTILGMPFHDCTSGFRGYRGSVLREKLKRDKINSTGYSILVEILYQLFRAGCKIIEHPIVYSERREGQSKMSKKVIFEAFYYPWLMLIKYNLSRPRSTK